MIRFHIEAIAFSMALIAAGVAVLGLTVLRHASEEAASLAGLGIGTAGLTLGHGIALCRLHRRQRTT